MLKIADIMTTRIVTIDMDDRLTIAKEIFDNAPFHHLLVTEENELKGMLSERDLLRAISPNVDANPTTKELETLQKRVHQVMTRDPLTVAPHISVIQASQLILEQQIGSLPVLDNGELVGIVTWKDLLAAMIEAN